MDKIKKRETQKFEISKCHRDIYEKRYKLEDFDNTIYNEILALKAKEQNSCSSVPKSEKHKAKVMRFFFHNLSMRNLKINTF